MRKESPETIAQFTTVIWDHYRKHDRNDLPWRKTTNPYRIVVSELMLQQTQVSRVIPKYRAFLKRFPSFTSLAGASVREVLEVWQGLGYNRRALLLKRLAEVVVKDYRGKLPDDYEVLLGLPGIGPATAAAILAFAFNKPALYIDTNVRRVYLHHFFPDKKNVHDNEIKSLVTKTMDEKKPREWNWALLDYGAMLGTQKENANVRSAHYVRQSKFDGSMRQLRGKVIRALVNTPSMTKRELAEACQHDNRIGLVIEQLKKEHVVAQKGNRFFIT